MDNTVRCVLLGLAALMLVDATPFREDIDIFSANEQDLSAAQRAKASKSDSLDAANRDRVSAAAADGKRLSADNKFAAKEQHEDKNFKNFDAARNTGFRENTELKFAHGVDFNNKERVSKSEGAAHRNAAAVDARNSLDAEKFNKARLDADHAAKLKKDNDFFAARDSRFDAFASNKDAFRRRFGAFGGRRGRGDFFDDDNDFFAGDF